MNMVYAAIALGIIKLILFSTKVHFLFTGALVPLSDM